MTDNLEGRLYISQELDGIVCPLECYPAPREPFISVAWRLFNIKGDLFAKRDIISPMSASMGESIVLMPLGLSLLFTHPLLMTVSESSKFTPNECIAANISIAFNFTSSCLDSTLLQGNQQRRKTLS